MVETGTSKFLLRIKLNTVWLIAIELMLAFLNGLGCIAWGMGEAAWIFGGILSGAIVFYGIRRLDQPLEPNRNSRKLGQMLIGLAVGCSVQPSDLIALPVQLPVFVLLTGFLLLSSGIIGYLYSRIEKTDLLTALLASVPGNIGIMASVAADYGRNAALVSLVQLIRFTTITLVIPLIAHVSNSRDVPAVFRALTGDWVEFDRLHWLLSSVVLAITFLSVRLGTTLSIPVATFFCPIVVGIGFNLLLQQLPVMANSNFALPLLLKVMGQILLGITIGEYWGSNPKLRGSTVAYAAIPVGLILIVGFISAAIAKALTPWDWLTCLLVTAPGGSPEMIWIALALNHDVEVVTAGHLLRLIAINLSLPVLVSLACSVERRFNTQEIRLLAGNCTQSVSAASTPPEGI